MKKNHDNKGIHFRFSLSRKIRRSYEKKSVLADETLNQAGKQNAVCNGDKQTAYPSFLASGKVRKPMTRS